MVTTAQPSGEVLRDVCPLEMELSEKDACSRLGGCSDIVVDVHLIPRQWINTICHDVHWAELEDELGGDKHVTLVSRRDAICTYRHDMIDISPFLEVQMF